MYLSQRKNIRIRAHDYSSEDIYYITICTEGRQYLLGSKVGGNIKLSPIGELVQESWIKIGELYNHVCLDSFVIMPNHIHGIIVYRRDNENLKGKPLHTIMCNFKSFTTHEYFKDKFRITANLWQRGYYEHIIRHNELDQIRDYIINNPVNWENDRFFELESKFLQSV